MTDRRPWRDHPLAQLTLVRFREFAREPEALFWVFVFPVLLAAGLGLAFRNKPAQVLPVAATTEPLAAALRTDSLLAVQLLPAAQAAESLRLGRVALVAEPDTSAGVTYRFDDTSPEGRTARDLADGAVQRAAGRTDPVATRDVEMHETGSRYIDFLIPGLLGMNLMGSSMWGIGFAIVDARRKLLLKRFLATPMRRSHYLMAFLLSRLVLLVLEVLALMGVGILVFGVPMRGSWTALISLCVLGGLTFGSLGLLVASRARTIEAASGMMNLVMMPMWILSGVFFSTQRFPDAIMPVIRALPLTALIDALRSSMLQGASLASLGTEIAVLGVWLVVSFVLAMKLFRWR